MSTNVITIAENAQYLLDSNSDLKRDADISNAVIYQSTKSYKHGYQPLLTSPHTQTPSYHHHFDNFHDEEDMLLHPNTYKSTMSIGGQSNLFDNESELKADFTSLGPTLSHIHSLPNGTFHTTLSCHNILLHTKQSANNHSQ